jgi:hypothetical protein
VTRYTLTPFSDEVYERANAVAVEMKANVAIEKELRKGQRQRRIDATPREASNRPGEKNSRKPAGVITRYKYLSSQSSVESINASVEVA